MIKSVKTKFKQRKNIVRLGHFFLLFGLFYLLNGVSELIFQQQNNSIGSLEYDELNQKQQDYFKNIPEISSLSYPSASGYIRDWLYAGSFACGGFPGSLSGGSHVDTSINFKEGDYATPSSVFISGSDGTKTWTLWSDADDTISFNEDGNAAHYILTYFYLPNDISTLYYGETNDDGYRIYIDGVQKYEAFTFTSTELWGNVGAISKGWHRLIILIENGSGPSGCTFRFSIVSGTYTAVPGMVITRDLGEISQDPSYSPDSNGFIKNWLVTGPFSCGTWATSYTNDGNHIDPTIDYIYGENVRADSTNIPGTDITKTWNAIEMTPVNFETAFGLYNNVAGWAQTDVFIPATVSNLYANFTADDGIRIFFDGIQKENLHSYGISQFGCLLGTNVIGWHRITVMVEDDGGDWTFSLRLSSTNTIYTQIPSVKIKYDAYQDNNNIGNNNGFLKEWLIAGPFWEGTSVIEEFPTINGNFIDCSQQYYEGQLISPGSIALNSTELTKTWQKYISPTININFREGGVNLFPNEYVAVYAFTNVYFPENVPQAYVRYGTDDGYRVFFDGVEKEYLHFGRGAAVDQNSTLLGNVSKGWHRLLIMVENGWAGWEMYVRISSAGNLYHPIHGLICAAAETQITLTGPSAYYEQQYSAVESRILEWKPTSTIDNANLDHNPTIVQKPQLWYAFEDSTSKGRDYSGNGLTGTTMNSPSIVYDSIRGNVLDFMDGTGYIQLPNLGSYSTASISFWINLKGTPTAIDAVFHSTNWDSPGRIHMSMRGTNNRQISAPICQNSAETTNPTIQLQDNIWYYYTMTYSTSTKQVIHYINGRLNNLVTLSTANSLDLTSINLGYFTSGDPRSLNAKMDDVMVFNRVLSATEIQAIYDKSPAWMQYDNVGFSFNSSTDLGKDNFGSQISATFNADAYYENEAIRGNSLKLINDDGYMQISHRFSLTNEWSATAWYKDLAPMASDQFNTLFHGSNYHLLIRRSDMQIGAFDTVEGLFFGSGYCIPSNQQTGWHHIAAISKNGRVSYFLDGLYVGMADGYTPTNDEIFGIGNNGIWLHQRFSDNLDDVNFYRHALNPTEVQILALNGTLRGLNGIYQITQNNTIVKSGLWNTNINITYDISGFTEGIYDFAINVSTSQGNLASLFTRILIDATNPTNPTSCTDLSGSTNNIWQHSVPSPEFIWSGADDLITSVVGYEIYFGDSSSGTSSTFQTATTYTPGITINSGVIYYFRLRAKDRVGHYDDWETMYVFKYDNTIPENPDDCTQDGTISNIWQNTDNTPYFYWTAVIDDARPIANYEVYWGTNSGAESGTNQTTTFYDVGTVESNTTHYLRMRTWDVAGNVADWETLYVFKYDNIAPTLPTLFTCTTLTGGWGISISNNTWQNLYNTPNFYWEGASEGTSQSIRYYLYWGQDSDGKNDVDFQYGNEYNPGVVSSNTTMYLRFKISDGLNNGTWFTYYVIKFDDAAPINPISCSTPSVISNIWHNQIDTPTFTWTVAEDYGCGVLGYYVYWGPDLNGIICDSSQASNTYTPSQAVASSSTNYLRLLTTDGLNNATWVTLFIFKYDNEVPSIPTVCNSNPVIANNTWQNSTNRPTLSWSGDIDPINGAGIQGFYVYWGSDLNGETNDFQIGRSFTPGSAVLSNTTTYLRVKTTDGVQNTSWCTLFALRFDDVKPINPSIASQTVGTTNSNDWQNETDSPIFNWDAATDEGALIKGYAVYWGLDENALNGVFQTSLTYNPSPVESNSTYYLKIRAIDNANNYADWTILYIFKFDNCTPSNITSCVQLGTESGVWQNSISLPTFAWYGALDSGSGIGRYYYYWGIEEDGESYEYNTSASFTPSMNVPSGSTYYFRVLISDNLNQNTTWATLYVFKFDNEAPTNPVLWNQIIGSTVSNQWQNITNNPSFTWSAGTDAGSFVEGYDVYWGPSSTGTTGIFQKAQSFTPSVVLSNSTYYLRIRTVDNATNYADWLDLYIFKFDNEGPTSPVSLQQLNGTTQSGQWQKYIGQPNFIWTNSTDFGIGGNGIFGEGINKYFVYWGTDPNGVNHSNFIGFCLNPNPVISETSYYLRIMTQDTLFNNGTWTTVYIFRYDITPPTNPTTWQLTNGLNNSGVWQNEISNPHFNWTGVQEGGDQGPGFYVYWGPLENGESFNFQRENETSGLNAISNVTYYLRIMTTDGANNKTWFTLYVFRYDNAGPNAPTSCDQPGTTSDVWQNSINLPSLTWINSIDDGIAETSGYFVYWGTDSNGESSYFQFDRTYNVITPTTTNQVYYLRICANDTLGNIGNWQTVYIFKYDNIRPINPTISGVIQSVGTTTPNVWQSTVASPIFTWTDAFDSGSQVRGYYVYWGSNSLGENSTFQLSNTLIASPAESEISYYLRVRAIDFAGNNASGWVTLYHFKYDHIAPRISLCNQTVGNTISSSWQNSVNQPNFIWNNAEDLGFGIQGYFIYWGTDINGEGTDYRTINSFNASNVISTSSVWYLRIQTTDGHNVGAWTTVYIFKYDNELPFNPVDVYSNSHKFNVRNDNNIIEVAWSNPYDKDSEVAGYCAIWTKTPTDTFELVLNCTTDKIYSPPLANGTWYFILYTVDNAGNWVTTGKKIGPFTIGTISSNTNPPPSDNPTDTTGSDNGSTMIIIYSVVGSAIVVGLGIMIKVRAKSRSKSVINKDLEKIIKSAPQTNDVTKAKTEVSIISKEIPIKDLTQSVSTSQAKINLGLEKNVVVDDLNDFLNAKVEDVQSKPKIKSVEDTLKENK